MPIKPLHWNWNWNRERGVGKTLCSLFVSTGRCWVSLNKAISNQHRVGSFQNEKQDQTYYDKNKRLKSTPKEKSHCTLSVECVGDELSLGRVLSLNAVPCLANRCCVHIGITTEELYIKNKHVNVNESRLPLLGRKNNCKIYIYIWFL